MFLVVLVVEDDFSLWAGGGVGDVGFLLGLFLESVVGLELSLELLFEWGSKGLIVIGVLLEWGLVGLGEGLGVLGHSQKIFKFLYSLLVRSHNLCCIWL